jgi:RNA polymerase sigma-70 factor, ECF subfamily
MIASISAASISVPKTRSITPEGEIDNRLVERFREGDEGAFVEIMERYRGRIFSVSMGLLRNHADAEEITQDTFIRAHRGLVNFRGDAALATWLYRIALNLSRNRYWYFFRRRRQDSMSLDATLSEGNTSSFGDLVADTTSDPAQEAAAKDFTSLIERCMERLEGRHREILTLRNILHQTYEEIAVNLKLNVGTVKSRIARARESLRLLIGQECPEFAPEAAMGEWFLPARGTYGSPLVVTV